MRRAYVDIELERPQDFIFIYADILSQFFHLLFVERLSPVCSKVYDVVKAIAECFEPTVDVFEL